MNDKRSGLIHLQHMFILHNEVHGKYPPPSHGTVPHSVPPTHPTTLITHDEYYFFLTYFLQVLGVLPMDVYLNGSEFWK